MRSRTGSKLRDHEQLKLDQDVVISREGFNVTEHLHTFEVIITDFSKSPNVKTKFQLDLFEAANLRNRLTAWMNNKKRRDMKAGVEDGS